MVSANMRTQAITAVVCMAVRSLTAFPADEPPNRKLQRFPGRVLLGLSRERKLKMRLRIDMMGWLKSPGPPNGGGSPRHFLCLKASENVRILSVFVDESGDFGKYQPQSPFYIVTLLLHDQNDEIAEGVGKLNKTIAAFAIPTRTIHAGPLIRRESEYRDMSVEERRRIFHKLFQFTRTVPITYHPIIVEKKNLTDSLELNAAISKRLSAFLFGNLPYLLAYDRVIVYYDNGQMELTNILVALFNAVLSNVEFRKVKPADYKLFQAADLLCTLELLALKAETKTLSQSENVFFMSYRALRKTYLKPIRKNCSPQVEIKSPSTLSDHKWTSADCRCRRWRGQVPSPSRRLRRSSRWISACWA